MATPLLFSPERVEQLLERHPTLARLIASPYEEGEPSEAFPGVLRKTDREIYRWIANTTSYPHLLGPIAQLERVLTTGCSFDRLLKTRDREQFVSDTAEVFVADDLLRRDYSVTTIKRSDSSGPDLHVAGRGIEMAIEVYSPRELTAVDEWVHEIGDLAQYIDVAASFDSRIATAVEQVIPPDRAPPDPWEHATILEQTRGEVIAEISDDVESAVGALQPFAKVYRHGHTRLTTTVEIENVRASPAAGPRRSGAFSYPGFTGYSPAGVFRRVVERTERKARKRQVDGAPAPTRALVVYLMGTKIAADLLHPAHMAEASAVVEKLDPTDFGLDVMAFAVRALPEGLAAIFAVADDAQLTREQVEATFLRHA